MEGYVGEAERHSQAEYSYRRLPIQFQKYISEYLAEDERILWAIHRPRMRSALERGFLRGKTLQESVFMISDQQVTEVAELMQPDRAGIRYGFVARSSVPERLSQAKMIEFREEVVGLEVAWSCAGGVERHIFEFPSSQRTEVETAVELLLAWLPVNDDRRLKRAEPPGPPDVLPALSDPGTNDPTELEDLSERLAAALSEVLEPGEPILARCLLPDWIEGREGASLLAIAPRRLLVVPDLLAKRNQDLSLDLAISSISSLKYCSTIVLAYLTLFVPVPGSTRINEITVEFGKTLGGNGHLLSHAAPMHGGFGDRRT